MLKYVYSDECECDQCKRVRVQIIEAIAEGQRHLDEATKKVGMGSALSHACDSQGVCDTPAGQDARRLPANTSETHTNTHTDDATHCKHDTCDG